MALAIVPVFKLNYETEDPITTLISKVISQNLELLEEVPRIQKQLSEIEDKNDLENKEIEMLETTLTEFEVEIEYLERSIECSTENLLRLIKQKRLTKKDFMERNASLYQYASLTLEQCSRLGNCIGNCETSDVGCQTPFPYEDENLSLIILEKQIIEWHTNVKKTRASRSIHVVNLVLDESSLFSGTSKLTVDDRKIEPVREKQPRPIWMSQIIYQLSTSSASYSEKFKCIGCDKKFKARKARGSTFPELDGVIHCVEKCDQFKKKGGIFTCVKCGLKYINRTEYELHVGTMHDETPSKPKWMSNKIYEESFVKFKPNTTLKCPGCDLEFEAYKRGRYTMPSYYLYVHSIDDCIDCDLGGLLRTCTKCQKKFMRDYGFNNHCRNSCDAKFNMKF